MADVLTKEQAEEKLIDLDGWELSGKAITRTFEFDDFDQAMDFVNHVAAVAEEHDHHPDIDIRYGTVKLSLSSHSAGGLTEADFALATTIDEIPE
ncbi:MAG: 4a-hydroxytetrahydrobiopterin dehydratase [bacterium]|nr:4a-hydroxytetrahydrobiopterin dehydratase [bacterium]